MKKNLNKEINKIINSKFDDNDKLTILLSSFLLSFNNLLLI